MWIYHRWDPDCIELQNIDVFCIFAYVLKFRVGKPTKEAIIYYVNIQKNTQTGHLINSRPKLGIEIKTN